MQARGIAILGSSSNTAAGVTYAMGYQLYANPATAIKALAFQFCWPGVHSVAFKAVGYQIYIPLFPPTFNFTVDYDFMEERFPDCISFSSSGGPGFKTNVIEFDSGIVETIAEWDRLRARYDVTFEVATQAEIKLVEDFFYTAKGKAIGFRFKDWKDYQVTNQNIGIGDGSTFQFQFFKRYISGLTSYDRVIKKPLKISSNGADMVVTVDDVVQTLDGDFFVNESLGTISFEVPPVIGAIVKVVYGEFDVPVRFDTDELDISFDDFRQLSLEVPLIEVLL